MGTSVCGQCGRDVSDARYIATTGACVDCSEAQLRELEQYIASTGARDKDDAYIRMLQCMWDLDSDQAEYLLSTLHACSAILRGEPEPQQRQPGQRSRRRGSRRPTRWWEGTGAAQEGEDRCPAG